ncbi:hypothetical protein SGLAM104S_03385 [Streptomyces glaucescens]
MNSADGWGDDVYQPDASDQREDTGVLDAEDTLEYDGVDDPLDPGWSLLSDRGRWSTPG